MASHRPLYSVQPRRISNIPGLNDQQQMTSVKNWETDNTKSTPKVKIERYTKEPYRRDQYLLNAHPFESKATNSQVCLRCGEEIADLSNVFVGKCCKNQCMCWNCFASAKSPNFSFSIHCNCCGQTLFKHEFHLQNLSAVLMSAPPKCNSCELERELEYILPDDRQICSGCFDNQMFTRSVKSTDKQQIFIGYKTNDIITPMKLFPIQRVHRIAYGKWNNYQGLACSCCRERLQGNCYELECHHHACFKCCDSNAYCTICCEYSCPIDTVEFHGIQHSNLFNRKVTVKEECMETKQDLYGNRCTVHQKIGIRITCDTSLCSDCFNEMADRRVSVIYGGGAAEEHCICRCKPTRGKHIISVASLIEAESQIEYLENFKYGRCQQCIKYVHTLVTFRECGHELCCECMSKGLCSKHHQRCQDNKLNGKSRMLFRCVIYSCKSMVPTDQLKVLNRELQSAMPMTDLEMTKLLNKGLVANSPPSSTSTERCINTSESMEFADEACSSGTDGGTTMVVKQPSDKDHKRMTAGHSSNSCKSKQSGKQSGKHKHEPSPIEDKLSPPQSAYNVQEMTDNEAVGPLEITDKENKNNRPSKKRLKTFFNEKPFTDTCSRNKNHQKAIIEFKECSHRFCEDCIEKKLSTKRETVFCGCRTGHRSVCVTKVPLEYVVKFLDRDENNMVCAGEIVHV
ncbi:uncharacterized protein [Argopecten irradians]|uniref:uncharacterized protein n=1 Tax=Argopecten irradians TaxID=31199 RepID=UPI0037190446